MFGRPLFQVALCETLLSDPAGEWALSRFLSKSSRAREFFWFSPNAPPGLLNWRHQLLTVGPLPEPMDINGSPYKATGIHWLDLLCRHSNLPWVETILVEWIRQGSFDSEPVSSLPEEKRIECYFDVCLRDATQFVNSLGKRRHNLARRLVELVIFGRSEDEVQQAFQKWASQPDYRFLRPTSELMSLAVFDDPSRHRAMSDAFAAQLSRSPLTLPLNSQSCRCTLRRLFCESSLPNRSDARNGRIHVWMSTSSRRKFEYLQKTLDHEATYRRLLSLAVPIVVLQDIVADYL